MFTIEDSLDLTSTATTDCELAYPPAIFFFFTGVTVPMRFFVFTCGKSVRLQMGRVVTQWRRADQVGTFCRKMESADADAWGEE